MAIFISPPEVSVTAGALRAGRLSSAIGRKRTLLICAFLFAITGVATGWGNFFTTASFPILKEQFGLRITFTIHAVICFIYVLFVKSRIPETKGRSLEEVERQLIKKL